MKPKHTPGPWNLSGEVNRNGDCDVSITNTSDKGYFVGVLTQAATRPQEQREANAQLMVCSPELLERLKQFATRFSNDIGSTQYEEVMALIAKAEGRDK